MTMPLIVRNGGKYSEELSYCKKKWPLNKIALKTIVVQWLP